MPPAHQGPSLTILFNTCCHSHEDFHPIIEKAQTVIGCRAPYSRPPRWTVSERKAREGKRLVTIKSIWHTLRVVDRAEPPALLCGLFIHRGPQAFAFRKPRRVRLHSCLRGEVPICRISCPSPAAGLSSQRKAASCFFPMPSHDWPSRRLSVPLGCGVSQDGNDHAPTC